MPNRAELEGGVSVRGARRRKLGESAGHRRTSGLHTSGSFRLDMRKLNFGAYERSLLSGGACSGVARDDLAISDQTARMGHYVIVERSAAEGKDRAL